ncbi:MAG: hypothetical protein SVX43_03720 [Cyanobacteriota bacterium]|nr:hypothetical protein [Cyanobacteriota bacterium]
MARSISKQIHFPPGGRSLPAIDRTSGQPRWEQVSLSDLGTVARSGNLQSLGRTWRSGQTPDQFLALEDLASSLAPQEFNLAQIGDLVGFDPQKVALSELPMATNAALSQLAESIPQLKEFPMAQIPPVAELASQLGVGASDIQSTLDEALSNSSSLGSSQLSQLSQSLNSYSIGDIPNLDLAQLKDLPGWEKAKLSDVPGLGQVPLSEFPNPLALGGAVMRIDMVYGTAETSRDNTISGSSEMGFSVKCAQPNEKCAYIELDDLENSGREQRGSLEGKQWISGKYQSVEGGSGCLKIVNGGKEPTGRHPFGEAFKVVVMEPDETKDEVNTALFFRFCTFCGCTPYFLGPIPFLSYRRDDNIFVGALKGGGGDDYSEPWDLSDGGSGIRAQLEAALAAAGVSPCGSGYSGNYASAGDLNLEGVPLASGNLVNRVVAAVPNAYQHSKVKTTVQQIVGAALERGITDPAHIAYMLATAQYETTMGRIAVEGTGTRSLSTS